MKNRIVVIGGLAAGPSAAAKAKRVDPDTEVVLYEQGEHVSYGICEIPFWLGGIITDPDLLNPFSPERLGREKGVKALTSHLVEYIDPVQRKIIVRDLWRERVVESTFHKLVMAAGSLSRRLNVHGENARNVFFLKSLANGYAIKNWLKQEHPQRAVIVGGGYVGVEMAEALRRQGLHVQLILHHSFPLNRLEEPTRHAVRQTLQNAGVEIFENQIVERFEVDSANRAAAVVTTAGRLNGDLFVVAIGVQPNTELARNAGIRLGSFGGIVTDERQCTSLDGIYAAGDCCETKNLVTNRHSYMPLATVAARQGRIAGENVAGGSALFKGALGSTSLKLFDKEFFHAGLTSQQAREAGFDCRVDVVASTTKVGFYPGSESSTVVGISERKTRRLLGVDAFGGVGTVHRGNTMTLAIQQRMTLDDIARTDLAYSPPFSPLWDPILTLSTRR
ncbi:MAG: FAD-dependent oxidoreductase [Ignavibacteriales bacterium]|nr:FAD-dependent oxidoreductase [Ignavibacteriales bacterium]